MQKWDDAVTAFEDVRQMVVIPCKRTMKHQFAVTNENDSQSIFEVQFGGPYSDDNGWILDDNGNEDFKSTQGTCRPYFLYCT